MQQRNENFMTFFENLSYLIRFVLPAIHSFIYGRKKGYSPQQKWRGLLFWVLVSNIFRIRQGGHWHQLWVP